MSPLFRYGHATHPQWRMCAELALAQVEGQANDPEYASRGNLGFVYIGAPLAEYASDILMLLKTRTGVIDWVGTVGGAILSSGVEYRDEPALAIMIAALPPGSFQVFSGTSRLPALGSKTGTGADAAWAALVHADPGLADIEGLIRELSGKVEAGYLFGGLSSGSVPPLPQIANQTFSGGMSGVAFASNVGIRTRVTQGCSPLASDHLITACDGNLITSLDDEPALDTLLTRPGRLGRDPRPAATARRCSRRCRPDACATACSPASRRPTCSAASASPTTGCATSSASTR